jgi:hypothetical protein
MKVWYLLSISLFPLFLSAQNNLGARLTALGNIGTAVSDAWSIQANPAALHGVTTTTLSAAYLKSLFSNEVSTQAFVAVLPIKNNFVAASFQGYGLSEYKESKVGFTYAKNFGPRLTLALNANYHQLKIAGYGVTTGFSLDAGAYYQLTKELAFGTFAANVSNQDYTSKETKIYIPVSYNLGVSYMPSDKVLVAATINKVLKGRIDVGIGIDYRIIHFFSLRGGLTVNPFKQYGGFGLKYKHFILDMATVYDANLGYSPQMAISYAF